ncbi:MAG: UTP-glucose-1-phosphate uridylyltransferase, partial [Saprospiraceae bacterium]
MTLLILAAGMGSRYGGLKQMDPVGPAGEAIIDYSIYDAIKAGFDKVVFVIRKDFEEAFRAKFDAKLEGKIEVAYAFQSVDAPIEGIDKMPERVKPWGTGHAVLVAADVINEPFAVINADDYYGLPGFKIMANFLKNDCSASQYSMVGYELNNTLSDNGTVSRGICDMD